MDISWHFWAQAWITSSWKGKAYLGLEVRNKVLKDEVTGAGRGEKGEEVLEIGCI